MPWEDYVAGQMPSGSRLPLNFKTFDFFDPATGTATSAKTLETFTRNRVVNPIELYRSLVKDIDKVADLSKARKGPVELNANQIKSRVIEIAIPASTTPGPPAAGFPGFYSQGRHCPGGMSLAPASFPQLGPADDRRRQPPSPFHCNLREPQLSGCQAIP
ncbi:MAG TPA: hypothetical protein VHY22_14310 [Chthoniobacteraceae bacterium]|nr:hypothetical protein [Chthoniobacteraceae bacterium]